MLNVKIGTNLSMNKYSVSTSTTIGDFIAEYGDRSRNYTIQGETVTPEICDMTFAEYHEGDIPSWTLILSVIKADNA